MAQVSEVVLRYAAQGAQRAQRADQNVRESIKETAQTAREETGTVNRWMSRHQTALLAIGAATTAAMGAIISASPALSAQLSEIRFGFSLLAMAIGEDVAPQTQGLADSVIDLADAYDGLPGPIRSVISNLVFFGGVLGTLAIAAAGLQTVLSGTFVATLGGKVVGVLKTAGAAIAGSTGAIFALAGAVGAAIGFLGVWILKITGVLEWIRGLGAAIGNFIGGPGTGFLLLLATIVSGGVLPLIAALGGFITGVLEGGLPEGIRRAKEALSVFLNAFGELLDAVIMVGSSLIDGFVNAIRGGFNKARQVGSDIVDAVGSKLSSLPGDALRWGQDLMDNFVDGIYERVESVESLADDVISKVENALGFDLEKNDRMARRWGRDLITEFTRGVEQRTPTLRAQVQGVAQGGFGLSGAGRMAGRTAGTQSAGSSTTEIVFERGAIQLNGTGDSEQDIQRIVEEVKKRLGGGFGSRSRV